MLCDALGIDDSLYVKLEVVKANYVAPSPAIWLTHEYGQLRIVVIDVPGLVMLSHVIKYSETVGLHSASTSIGGVLLRVLVR